ncbi:uncharacterized protein LOC142544436 [Primulina tabacum]|uniref:uncharacterized protein LOC142544436 n=1 Tax=Primulina tabacum TaxID=48773 RepID=UPI003F59630B
MCVDFRDLNKACPKDCYPLPRIDQLVDSTAGHQYMCMLDAYQRYHQIPLAVEDQDKMSFIISEGTFCYVVMPFEFKNAGATYQRLMDRVFYEQVGRNVEVYVDDIMVKSRDSTQLIPDLVETFSTLRSYGLKLNPQKCIFGVRSGKFLGYMVTERGIEANPEKVRAIRDMAPPRGPNDVQKLVGRIAALARFISRSAHRSLPFFRTLRKAKKFEWNPDCEKAFGDLKKYLAELPVLAKPVADEALWVYLSATERAVSSVLVKLEGSTQQPVCYVLYALKGVEIRYSELEKLALALVMIARHLRPYFLSHPIVVLTNSPLGRILTHSDMSGSGLLSWEYTTSRWQWGGSSTDFASWGGGEVSSKLVAQQMKGIYDMKDEKLIEYAQEVDRVREKFTEITFEQITMKENEKADTLAKMAGKMGSWKCSELFIEENFGGHVTLQRQTCSGSLVTFLHSKTSQGALGARSREYGLVSFGRGCGRAGDGKVSVRAETRPRPDPGGSESQSWKRPQPLGPSTSRLHALWSGSLGGVWRGCFRKTRDVVFQVELTPHTSTPAAEHEEEVWRTGIIDYLKERKFPDNPREARKLKTKWPLLRCLSYQEADYVLREVHEGCCGNHLGAYALARKVLLVGYCWPSVLHDAQELVMSCDSCQQHAWLHLRPTAVMKAIADACPFDQWGMDIVGPFPIPPAQKKFLLVAVDYFQNGWKQSLWPESLRMTS